MLESMVSEEVLLRFRIYLVPTYYVYTWTTLATMLLLFALPLRVVYLLFLLRFKDAAIDAALVVTAFGILYVGWKLAPVTV